MYMLSLQINAAEQFYAICWPLYRYIISKSHHGSFTDIWVVLFFIIVLINVQTRNSRNLFWTVVSFGRRWCFNIKINGWNWQIRGIAKYSSFSLKLNEIKQRNWTELQIAWKKTQYIDRKRKQNGRMMIRASILIYTYEWVIDSIQFSSIRWNSHSQSFSLKQSSNETNRIKCMIVVYIFSMHAHHMKCDQQIVWWSNIDVWPICPRQMLLSALIFRLLQSKIF